MFATFIIHYYTSYKKNDIYGNKRKQGTCRLRVKKIFFFRLDGYDVRAAKGAQHPYVNLNPSARNQHTPYPCRINITEHIATNLQCTEPSY